MINSRLIKSNDSGGGVCTSDEADIFGDSSGIALYQLNWDGSDMSGNYDGVATDVSFVNGHIDSAGSFNGSSSKVDTTYTTNMPTFSWSAWIKPNQWIIDNAIISKGNWNVSGANFAFFGFTGGTLQLLVRLFNGSLSNLNSSVLPSLNVWSHIAVTLSGSNANIYVNGVNTGTTSSINNVINNTQPIKIGNNNLGAIFNGDIDQVRIFNKAITSTEVTTLYNEVACEKTCTTDTPQIVPDCIAYYKLDGNATDSNGSGTLYDGTATNVSWTQGRFGSAGGFNGTSSYINNGYIPSLVTQEFSISTWVKFSALTDNQTIASNYVSSGGTSRGWFIRYTSSNGLQFAFRNSTTDISLSNNYVPNISEWINVCVVISATSKTLYIDGVVNATLGSDSIIYLGNQETYFGRLGILGIQYLNGDIDQVRIFNKAISAEEVTTLYNEVAC